MARSGRLLEHLRRDAAHLARLDARTALDLLRAARELAIARWRLISLTPEELTSDAGPSGDSPPDTDAIDRIVPAIQAVAARVPWRSDCLVQALAAQRWLRRRGVNSSMRLGVRQPNGRFDAHAWLTVGGKVVIGGDVDDYSELPMVRRTSRKPR
jgi:transglutaminase superfamily protein